MKKSFYIKLIISLIIPIGIGAIAGMFTAEAVSEWYAGLIKQSFSPPNYLFGPVWTTLYILMGLSFFLVWESPASEGKRRAILFYILQLVLNFAWSFLFFYFHWLGWALVEIIVLWVNIAFMIVLFYRIKPIAAFINIPYLLWVSFATLLNASYYILN